MMDFDSIPDIDLAFEEAGTRALRHRVPELRRPFVGPPSHLDRTTSRTDHLAVLSNRQDQQRSVSRPTTARSSCDDPPAVTTR